MGGASAAHRIILLFFGLVAGGAFLLFGIASWLGSIPTKAAVFIGAVPPILFVIAAVWLLRSPDGSFAFNTEGLYWRWPVGLGFLVAAGACLVLLWWAKDDYDQARSGTHVVHKWQYRVRIIYQQVLGPAHRTHIAGCRLERAARLPPHRHHLGGALWPACRVRCSACRRDLPVHRRPRQEVHLIGVFHAAHPAHLRAAGVRHPARGVLDRAGRRDDPVTIFGFYVPLLAIIGFAGVFAGFIVNANYIGIGRMYRDRLMELFMPDKEAIRDNQWRRAGNADQFDIAKLWTKTARRSGRCTW